VLLPGLLAVGLLAALVWGAGLQSLREALRQISFAGLGLALGAYALTWACRTLRLWVLTVHGGRRLGAWVLFRLYISAFAINSVLPARLGDAAHVLYLHWRGLELGRAAAIVVQSRVLDAAALVLASLPALGVLLMAGQTPGWVASGLLLCLLFVVLPGAVVWLEARTRLSGYLEKVALRRARGLFMATLQTGRDILAEYRAIVRDWRLWFGTLAVSLAIALGEGLTTWVVGRAVGAEVSFLVALFAVSVATIGKSATVTPGGIGVYEGVFAAVLTLFGVAFELALLIGLLDHGLKKAFNVLIGLPATGSQRPGPNHAVESRSVPGLMAAPQRLPE
jgi:uncharacterized protein (TIRG00374 family)